MPQTVEDVLKRVNFIVLDDTFRLLKLPPNAISAAAGIIAELGEPYSTLIVDKDEITLVIPDEAVEHFAARMPDYEGDLTYKIITADAQLEPDLIGFLAHLSAELAKNNVGFFPYAAYTRDHIMVPAEQIDRAIDTLNKLKQA
ncbi:MAG: ACT domain-containing protein [Chloroflexota bacterium]